MQLAKPRSLRRIREARRGRTWALSAEVESFLRVLSVEELETLLLLLRGKEK